ncbi:hypothetical protein NpPPO83_00005846 [Neofusicoccum parvum]|uniref:Uncharacterized protein n=1 Tax=Neofusicoccum parvum TaxID=310453 RepID=A0ACB5RS88_9PEZI|nr:hypothetical protein NpPPO83_00005846 [Neofusicoccum parvum]
MCEGCAVKHATSKDIGFGTLDCDCDLEPNCLEHRKPVLEGLHNSLVAFSKKHRTKKRRGAHDQPSDGCPATKCPACCKNTPPPVGTHFAYMCVACSGAVVLPPPADAHAWQTGRPGQLQGFIAALGRPSSHANLERRKRVAADDDATQHLAAPKRRELEAEGKARAGGEAPVRPGS